MARQHRAVEKLGIAQNGHAGGLGRDRRRMGARQFMRNAGGKQQRVSAERAGGRVLHRQPGSLSGRAGFGLVIPGGDISTPGSQAQRSGQAGTAQPHHGDARAGKGGEGGAWRCHLIFSVESPTSARIMAMIQKRMTMVGSAQPFFSKW